MELLKKVDQYGTVFYVINDYNILEYLHREDGPAVEYKNGTKLWYINGKCHRMEGPAAEFYNGKKSWYLYDKLYSRTNHNRLVLFFILEPRKITLIPVKE